MFVLDIGQDAGALVVYTPESLNGEEVEISSNLGGARKVHTGVVERGINGAPVCAAVFPSLLAGDYTIWRPDPPPDGGFTIMGGQVTELDWR
ncbi:MAG: phospholipase [Chloroflexota bacterium]